MKLFAELCKSLYLKWTDPISEMKNPQQTKPKNVITNGNIVFPKTAIITTSGTPRIFFLEI